MLVIFLLLLIAHREGLNMVGAAKCQVHGDGIHTTKDTLTFPSESIRSQRSVRTRIASANQESSSKTSDDRTLQQEAQPMIQEVTGLLQFEESANLEMEKIPGRQKLTMISNPFPDHTPKEVLSRSYNILNYDWTSSATTVNLQFPQELFAIETIAHYLSIFDYFRAGVRISVRLNSTPYHQGTLVAGIIPCRNQANLTTWQRLNCRPVVLSASTQDSCTIDVPYLYPASWLDLSNYADYDICSFMLTQLNTLNDTSGNSPPSVSVSIFAAFINPECAGYVEPSSTSLKRFTKAYREKRLPKAQSSKLERFNKSGNKVKTLDGLLSGDDVEKEGEKKAKDGVTIKGVQKIVGGGSEILKMVPVIGPIWKEIAKFISTFGSVLDEPFDPSKIDKSDIDALMNDHAQCSGLFHGAQLTMYPGVQTSQDSFGMESSRMTIGELAQVPGLFQTTTFAHISDSFSFGLTPLTPNSYSGAVDFLGFTAAGFNYWRGGLKFLFHFVCSAFYSARFKIAYATTVPSTLDGDLPQMIVDVKGDTYTEVTIPYLFPLPWRLTGDSFAVGTPKLYISMITDIQGPALSDSATIYLNIWRSGAEDIQFNMIRSSYYCYGGSLDKARKQKKLAKSEKEIPKAQCTIGTRFKNKFEPIQEGSMYSGEFRTCNAELPISVSDVLKTWWPNDPAQYGNSFDDLLPYNPSSSNITLQYSPNVYFGNLFNFWRGSRRWRIEANAGDDITMSDGTDTIDDHFYIFQHVPIHVNCPSLVRRNNDVEIPWISQVPYVPTLFSTPNQMHITWNRPMQTYARPVSSALPDTWSLKMGDDFQYLYLLPPPDLFF
jgi:hypothetical protein